MTFHRFPHKTLAMFVQWRNLKSFELGTIQDICRRSRKITDRYGLVDETPIAFQTWTATISFVLGMAMPLN